MILSIGLNFIKKSPKELKKSEGLTSEKNALEEELYLVLARLNTNNLILKEIETAIISLNKEKDQYQSDFNRVSEARANVIAQISYSRSLDKAFTSEQFAEIIKRTRECKEKNYEN